MKVQTAVLREKLNVAALQLHSVRTVINEKGMELSFEDGCLVIKRGEITVIIPGSNVEHVVKA